MKTLRTIPSFINTFAAFTLLGVVTLTGCTASDMTGPQAPPEVESVQAETPASYMEEDAPKNGGNEGGGTTTTASHNTFPKHD